MTSQYSVHPSVLAVRRRRALRPSAQRPVGRLAIRIGASLISWGVRRLDVEPTRASVTRALVSERARAAREHAALRRSALRE